MPPAPIPPNEPERLASVQRLAELGHAYRATQTILDTLREQLTVNRAFINIVNESTQHPFLCAANGPESSDRANAFCGYVVCSGAPVVVPDAAKDPRFADNEFVTSGYIRFYYGAPIYTPEGFVAGALCVHGPEPREPTELEISLLKRLADMVTEELRLARRFTETERQFYRREEQLRLIIEHTPASIAILDRDLRYIAASRHWRRNFGLEQRDVVGLNHYELFPDLPERWKQIHQRGLAGESLSNDEDVFERADGTRYVVRWRVVPLRDEDGLVAGIAIFSENITEAVQTRRRLELTNERLRLALESANAGLWDWDLVDEKLHYDETWWKVHAIRPGSVSTDPTDSRRIVHPDDQPAFDQAVAGVVEGREQRLAHEIRVRNDAGEWVWFQIHAFAAERDADGRATRIVGLNLCTEERKRLELLRERQTQDLAAAKAALEDQAARLITMTAESRQAKAAAEAANQAKSRFLANMSHEIRTPMAAILGYAEILEDDRTDKQTRDDAVATIRRNGEHLINLINEILDLSKIEAGRMSVDRVRCDPGVIVRESAKLVAELAARKGLELTVRIDDDAPAQIVTDPTRLRQVLTNLLGNAVKFTESGSVLVRLASDPKDGCVFEVEDTGIGMTPEVIERIFEPFVQADASTTRRHGGTGLGLTISAQLAQILGGRLEVVRSAPGRGTTMRLCLDPGVVPSARGVRAPARPEPRHANANPAQPGASLVGARILMAEDGADNQRLFSFMLQREGAQVVVVSDGILALETLSDPDHGFDLLLLDMQMPELDGYETARTLRDRGCRIPIIALTANAMDGDRDLCLQAGCDDYASKPITSNELRRICGRWLHAAKSENRPAA